MNYTNLMAAFWLHLHGSEGEQWRDEVGVEFADNVQARGFSSKVRLNHQVGHASRQYFEQCV